MKTSRILFPDGQNHIRVDPDELHAHPEGFDLTLRIRNAAELLDLELIVDAMAGYSRPRRLTIPYLMGARSDRRMVPGDAHGLRVVAKRINALGFEQVGIFDPHSDVSLSLIERSVAISPDAFLRAAIARLNLKTPALIIPDAGARKHAVHRMALLGTLRSAEIDKVRDPATGALRIEASTTAKAALAGTDAVIIDDLCDGGGTFLGIARALGDAPNSLHLIVSHGIFSQGAQNLLGSFASVTYSNSYREDELPGTSLIAYNP